VASAAAGSGVRRMLVVDGPLASAQSVTARACNQEFYAEATAAAAAADSEAPAMDLRRGSMLEQVADVGEAEAEAEAGGNGSYTLWEFGGLRVMVRYGVDGFATAGTDGQKVATVTLKTKLEYQRGLAHSGREETTEAERLAWWLGSYMRGSPSEVWVSHVDVGTSQVVRVTRLGAGDLYECSAAAGSSPSTRGVCELMRELLTLAAGQYLLVHRRRTWDATIYRALDAGRQGSGAVLDLAVELAGGAGDGAVPVDVDIDSDYVPAAWQPMLPGQAPFTYPPTDLAEYAAGAKQRSNAGKRRRGGGQGGGRGKNKRSKR
ncbi:hypothetical protein FBU59_005951, partial [Linderina macrospora]